MPDNKHCNSVAKYNVALDLLKHEADLYWKIFGAFFLSQTVFLAFLLQKSSSLFNQLKWEPTEWVTALIGILLCFPWYASHLRRTEWYRFRMAQAEREEPNGFNLIKEDGKTFAD